MPVAFLKDASSAGGYLAGMDTRIDTLASMMAKTADVLAAVDDRHHGLPTPCSEFNVGDLLGHIALWVQVFDTSVNEQPLPFDPSTHQVTEGWVEIFGASSRSIVAGLRSKGFDRPMTMSSDPMPGEFILNMLLMEYIGHGWDLARAIGSAVPFTDLEAEVALAASQAILRPEYRGTGMFGFETPVADDANPIDTFVAFLGRNPTWSPT
jgi:uncharacterized protein (TIGR03086 family)